MYQPYVRLSPHTAHTFLPLYIFCTPFLHFFFIFYKNEEKMYRGKNVRKRRDSFKLYLKPCKKNAVKDCTYIFFFKKCKCNALHQILVYQIALYTHLHFT